MHARLMGRWMLTFIVRLWRMNSKAPLIITTNPPVTSFSNRTMTPSNTSKKAQTWLKDHGFTVMKWPAQSPDLNPIEHLWHHIKMKLRGYEEPPKGIHELWECVEAEWEKIDAKVCQNLIESMPRRVEAVSKAKGGYTKY